MTYKKKCKSLTVITETNIGIIDNEDVKHIKKK